MTGQGRKPLLRETDKKGPGNFGFAVQVRESVNKTIVSVYFANMFLIEERQEESHC